MEPERSIGGPKKPRAFSKMARSAVLERLAPIAEKTLKTYVLGSWLFMVERDEFYCTALMRMTEYNG